MFNYLKASSQYLIPKAALTTLAGLLANVKTPSIKNWLIRHFIRLYGVNMLEALEEQGDNYENFNAFFIRALKNNQRPLASADIVSPVDGAISEIGNIEQGQIFQAKGHYYSVRELLACDESLTNQFIGGRFATLYLAPKDYHRIHMPMDASLIETIYIPGKLFSVQPLSVSVIPNIFARNKRLVVLFDTEIGLMAMVLVGATIVGAIGTQWQGDIPASKTVVHTDFTGQNKAIAKGDEMGYFKLGSTVILLFADAQRMQWDAHVKAGSTIKFGQTLGMFTNDGKDA